MTAPADPLMAAFSAALGGAPVDPDESLFDLGGTSLTALRLCVGLSRLTGLSIPISIVLRHSSVSEMRAWIAQQSVAAPGDESPAGSATSSPLTGMQSGFLFQHVDGEDVHNNSYSAWRIAGALEVDHLVAALQDVQSRHAYLEGRYTFTDKAMWNRCERPVAVEHLEATDEEMALPALQKALLEPFSLFEGDVWRVVLCEVEDGETWILGTSVHHIAFDGWSQRILLEELSEAYAARREGREAQFARPVQAPATIYAEMQRLRGLADIEGQLGYWVEELAGLPDAPAPWVSSSPCAETGVRKIDVELTVGQAELLQRRAVGGGLLPLFLAALGGALVDAAGAEDFTIGTPVSQRSTPVLQDPIACLINTMCTRLRANSAPDMVTDAQRVVLRNLRNSDPSIAEVARSAGLTGQQLFQVIGAVQDSPTARLFLDGCSVEPIELPYAHLAVPLVVDLLADDGNPSTVRVLYDAALVAEGMAEDVSAKLVAHLTDPG